ncbi:MAG: DUF3515 domain-containing protein [Nocardioidaceae bacterium]
MTRRPVLRNAGAGASLLLVILLGGCSHIVTIDSPHLPTGKAHDCRALVAALPGHIDDQKRRRVQPEGAYGAAWGDPAIVLTCGVAKPRGLDRFASCTVVNGVGWFIPVRQSSGQAGEIDMTTIGRKEFVTVTIPEQYFPPAATMADLAPAVKRAIPDVRPCV